MPRHAETRRDESHGRKKAVRVLVVDDHPIVRKGLIQLINDEPDLTVCGEAETTADALKVIQAERPDLAIVDLSLVDGSGLDLIKTMATSHPTVRVLVLSMHDELLYAERALRAGASGYVMKRGAMPDLLTAIRTVMGGKTYISEQVSERILANIAGRQILSRDVLPFARLTDREQEVFALIGAGLGTREIASRLDVSIKTIESHKARIKEKLGLQNASELIRSAVVWTQP